MSSPDKFTPGQLVHCRWHISAFPKHSRPFIMILERLDNLHDEVYDCVDWFGKPFVMLGKDLTDDIDAR